MLTVLDEDSWYTHVTLTGVIERIEDDLALADIDRREVIFRVGLASLVALPVITSLITPTAIAAAST